MQVRAFERYIPLKIMSRAVQEKTRTLLFNINATLKV